MDEKEGQFSDKGSASLSCQRRACGFLIQTQP